jgi:hypothetical protein
VVRGGRGDPPAGPDAGTCPGGTADPRGPPYTCRPRFRSGTSPTRVRGHDRSRAYGLTSPRGLPPDVQPKVEQRPWWVLITCIAGDHAQPVPSAVWDHRPLERRLYAACVHGPAPDVAAMTTEQNTQRPSRATASHPSGTARTSSMWRLPAAKKATAKPSPAAAAVDPHFEHGPLAVVDVEDGSGLRVLRRRPGPGRIRQVPPGPGRLAPDRGQARRARAQRPGEGGRPAARAHRGRVRALQPAAAPE